MKALVIAEKPSVARDIARVLKCGKKINGAIEGERYIVTWGLGHLVTLADPEDYDKKYKEWKIDVLPMKPAPFKLEVIKQTGKQFAAVKTQIHRKDVNEIIIATDAGREGELVARLILEKAGSKKPIKRLWISSVTDKAIREGFAKLKNGHEYDALYDAAMCRAEADWLVGINATRALTCKYNAQLSCGRVQTPTLAMLVDRDWKISSFKKEKYHHVRLALDGAEAVSEKIAAPEEAEALRADCAAGPAVCTSVTREQKKEAPPKLYDLTALQRDANRIYGYTAQQTLDYAQTLYEKKLATYPRTDSRFLTHDLRDRLPALIECVAQVLPFASGLPLAVHTQQVIRDEKVSDHHAIIPTQNMTREALAQLPMGERSILTLLAVRLLAATGEPCETDEVTVTLDCEGHDFTAKGSTVRQMGYRVFEETFRGSLGSRERKEQEYPIPPLEIGQMVGPVVATIREGQTTPPKRYTDVIFCERKEWIGIEERSSA